MAGLQFIDLPLFKTASNFTLTALRQYFLAPKVVITPSYNYFRSPEVAWRSLISRSIFVEATSEQYFSPLFNDEKLTGEYATALEGLSEDQLRSIASLKKKHLIEWVSTPSQLRPYKLEKLIEKSKSQIFLDKTKDNLTSTIEKGKNDFKRGAIQGLKWFWGFALILFVLFAVLIRIYG